MVCFFFQPFLFLLTKRISILRLITLTKHHVETLCLIIEIAHLLEIEVVAEGIETKGAGECFNSTWL